MNFRDGYLPTMGSPNAPPRKVPMTSETTTVSVRVARSTKGGRCPLVVRGSAPDAEGYARDFNLPPGHVALCVDPGGPHWESSWWVGPVDAVGNRLLAAERLGKLAAVFGSLNEARVQCVMALMGTPSMLDPFEG